MKKILPDGMMLVSKPIETPEGYERTSDPRIYVLKMQPCEFRGQQVIDKVCCGKVKIMYCTLYQRRTTRKECIACQS